MCGRFLLTAEIEEVIGSYNIRLRDDVADLSKGDKYPGTKIPVIIKEWDKELKLFRWGFKLKGSKKDLINARMETAFDKPLFKRAFYENRCIIPANAFYEWKTEDNGKIKYRISVKGSSLFPMAGLYKHFIDENNDSYIGVVILTCPANEQMSPIHDRMPVILKKEDEEIWLSKNMKDIFDLHNKLLTSYNLNLEIISDEGAVQISF